MTGRRLLRASAVALAVALAGCDIPIAFGQKIEGEITEADEHSTDSNDLVFYWDNYFADFTKDTVYDVELWSLSSDPIHFEIKDQDIDFSTEGNAVFAYTAPTTEKNNFDIYLRADYVDDGSKYAFKVTPR
jgi:hypothetical protein